MLFELKKRASLPLTVLGQTAWGCTCTGVIRITSVHPQPVLQLIMGSDHVGSDSHKDKFVDSGRGRGGGGVLKY